MFQFEFEWDPAKAQKNAKRHGITFDRAASIFLDRQALSNYDEEHSDGEERWVTLGSDLTGVVLVVCHTYHEESGQAARIRIISARKADRKETRQYWSSEV